MPRRNNNDPAPVLAPLPGEQYEENLLDVVTDPGLQSPMDFETGYDRINGLDASRDVPQQVVEDSYNMPETEVRRATPALQNEGSFFDLSYINDFRAAYQQALQQTGDPAKAVEMVRPIAQSWTPAQRHVYERTEGYAEVDPKYAAGLVQDWYAQQDRVAAQQADPVRQEQVRKLKTEADVLQENRIKAMQKTFDTAAYMDDLLEKLKTHPGRQYATGKSSILPKVPGTEPANFQVLLEQLEGQQFLQAFETLKGGGQITEVEGKKATAAMARMNPRQSEEAFLQGVNEFQEIIRAAKERAAAKIQPQESPSTPAAQSAAPRPSKTVAGIKWEKGSDGKWYQAR